jgi:predicted cupin superfamily sugar epimerase
MAFKQQDAGYWSAKLGMQKHPEGGSYRETYRSPEIVKKEHLPGRFGADRNFCTSIYFMLEGSDFSAMHRIKSDEIWHFYSGSPLSVSVISESGEYSEIILGDNPELGQVFQATVPAGSWFGSRVSLPGSFSLVGCTVSPGFDFADFEMADREKLQEKYPQHADIIRQLTK